MERHWCRPASHLTHACLLQPHVYSRKLARSFRLLGLTFTYRLYKDPNIKNALLTGIFVGCMFATKETFVITLFAWVVGLVACFALIHINRNSENKNSQTISSTLSRQLERLIGVCFFL